MTMHVSSHGCGLDIIGDVHGCHQELELLLPKLGYKLGKEGGVFKLWHPDGRKLVFVGDLVDRGPDSGLVLAMVMDWVTAGSAFAVRGNHEERLIAMLAGKEVPTCRKIKATLASIAARGDAFTRHVLPFLQGLPLAIVFDEQLLVVHAAYRQDLARDKMRQLALYGEVVLQPHEIAAGNAAGNRDARVNDWARQYDGALQAIVHGHLPVSHVCLIISASGAHIYNVDTGCHFSGKLSALRYPERQVIDVQSTAAGVKSNLDATEAAP